jgi:hypothetical protein
MKIIVGDASRMSSSNLLALNDRARRLKGNTRVEIMRQFVMGLEIGCACGLGTGGEKIRLIFRRSALWLSPGQVSWWPSTATGRSQASAAARSLKEASA